MRAFERLPNRRAVSRAGILLTTLPLLLLAPGGCSDATAPTDDAGNLLDPGSGTFTLKDLTIPGPDGRPVPMRLEGRDLVADPADGTVSLSVKVRNLAEHAVNPPLIVWLSDLRPVDVVPLNADATLPAGRTDPAVAVADSTAFGFDYTDLLGGAPLPAGDATPAKTWIFRDETLAPFSFAARIETGVFTGRARLGGLLFVDLDRDGQPDDGEPPYLAGGVQVTAPGGTVSWSSPGRDGRWATAIMEPGLYVVDFMSLEMGPLPIGTTTPNPRHVVITAGPDGALRGFLEAHVGVVRGGTPPPGSVIGFTDRSPGHLHRAPWTFLEADVFGPRLALRVGFSGCQPEHDFSLWMSGGFQESMPPRASLTLVHGTFEACDAAFTDDLAFDLGPLYARYVEAYGRGPLILVLNGPDGFVHEIELAAVPPDSIGPPAGQVPG